MRQVEGKGAQASYKGLVPWPVPREQVPTQRGSRHTSSLHHLLFTAHPHSTLDLCMKHHLLQQCLPRAEQSCTSGNVHKCYQALTNAP